MTIDEMIEVLEAYKNGKEIEYCDKFISSISGWNIVENPIWDFGNFNYRVKKAPTNLEVANELIKEKFGIEECFSMANCPLICLGSDKSCPENTSCLECEEWWNKEYKGN